MKGLFCIIYQPKCTTILVLHIPLLNRLPGLIQVILLRLGSGSGQDYTGWINLKVTQPNPLDTPNHDFVSPRRLPQLFCNTIDCGWLKKERKKTTCCSKLGDKTTIWTKLSILSDPDLFSLSLLSPQQIQSVPMLRA